VTENLCPACGSSDVKNCGQPIYSDKRSKYSVIECNICQLNWSNPMPTIDELDEHYLKYYEVRHNTVEKSEMKLAIRKKITFREYRLKKFFSLIKKFSPVNYILDFGCGEAEILYLAKKKQWQVLGVDYSNELSEKFNKENINFIQANDLFSINIEKSSVGCISAKHTIEHLTDLEFFFDSTRDILHKDGILAIKTPSSTSLRAKRGLSGWHHVNPPEHCWGFNLNNFGKLVSRNGFEVVYLKDGILVNELTCIARKI